MELARWCVLGLRGGTCGTVGGRGAVRIDDLELGTLSLSFLRCVLKTVICVSISVRSYHR